MDGDGEIDLFLGGIHDEPSKMYEHSGDATSLFSRCHFGLTQYREHARRAYETP
jgi:hypothetical protein